MSVRHAMVGAGLSAVAVAAALAAAPAPLADFVEDFERGLCLGRCAGAHFAIVQQVRGRVRVLPAPARAGRALLAEAGPKAGGQVAKADVVARFARLPAGTRVRVAFDLRLPAGTPRNSLQLVDLECATCGEGGNPGIRLYLRRGRLRVDRSKIGVAHAWTRDDAPQLRAGTWHRIRWDVTLDAQDGATRVTLDGQEVLAARGATLAQLPIEGADRVQIGITANSNPVPAQAWIDNVAVTIAR